MSATPSDTQKSPSPLLKIEQLLTAPTPGHVGSSVDLKDPVYDPSEDQETARRNIAYGLVVLLALVVVAALLSLWIAPANTANLKTILELILAPLFGVVGTVVGFYFGGKTR